MRRLNCFGLLYLVLGAGLLLSSGCIDFDQMPERECLEERRCGPGDEPVCGVDGMEYSCASMALCFGVTVDPSGEACGDALEPGCPNVLCEEECSNGYQVDEDGCETCECIPSSCPFTSCEDEPGAEPCPPGTELTTVGTDEQGCPVCNCRAPQCEISGADQCTAIHCGSPRGECVSPEDDIACPDVEPPYREPLPQCSCSGSECHPMECRGDRHCEGAGGLCVRTPLQDREGFCVDATCDDLVAIYDGIAERFDSCGSDSDCVMYRTEHQCCRAYAVSQSAVHSLQSFDQLVGETSCADHFAEACSLEDCQPLPTDPEHAICVNGQCEYAP